MTIPKNAFAALALMLPAALPAQGPSRAEATLAAPSDAREGFVVNGAIWHCAGTRCTGPAGNGRAGNARTCGELAARLGRVATYTGPAGALGEADLARCNARAKAAG